MIRTCIAAFVLLCSLTGQSEVDKEITLETLLERHTQARGGAAAIENIRALRVELRIVEPAFSVRGLYTATREGFMRIDIFASGDRVFTEALGPDGGWQLGGEGVAVKELSREGEAALRRGLMRNLYGLHELPEHGYTLSLAGAVRGEEKGWIAVDVTAPDQFHTRLLLSPDTWLVTRQQEISSLHPDIDPATRQYVTEFYDFSRTAGVLFSTRSRKTNRTTGEVVQTTEMLSVEVNPEVDPALFRRPQ